MNDYAELHKALEEMRKEFNARIDSIATQVSESEKMLALHDSKFQSLEESVREIRSTAHKTKAELHRLADALTTQGFSIERIERTTKATLDVLQKKVVL